ncbi:hypothetical protein MUN74_07700 [Agromyces endophyticus]|uniref:hypothetical protein n=1 Tax=Agromyces sp. H17E-10 TaxID=2932244 RepID=UPI001FD3F63F|nr:hypothetical protein [Agromyces sp. H17E-10]UOQ90774.1 hypothetical protein MUN74_07700 [Agromyces sp. H17E-10]
MLDTLQTAGRILAGTWPRLLAWYVAGWLARYLIIELAGTIGVNSTLGAFLVLPLAALARLVSFIAMFLTMREAMPNYSTLTGAQRPQFMSSVLAAILPFFLFYAAWGFLKDDVVAYQLSAFGKVNWFTDSVGEGEVDTLAFDVVTIAVVVATYAARWLIKRNRERLPKWTALVAAYCEAVWVFFTLFLIGDLIGFVTDWMNARAAVHWWNDFTGAVNVVFSWLDPVQQGIGWVLDQLGGLLLEPLAWLAIAGVVFGQALGSVTYGRLRALERPLEQVKARYAKLPEWSRRRLADVGESSISRWKTITDALLLIWRAGAVPMSLYVLAYSIVLAGEQWLVHALGPIVGPQEQLIWFLIDTPIAVVVDTIFQPLLFVLVAAAYDYCLASISRGTRANEGSSETTAIVSETSPVSSGTMNGTSTT